MNKANDTFLTPEELEQLTVKNGGTISLNSSCFNIAFKNRDEAFDALVSKVFGAPVSYAHQEDLCQDPDHDCIHAERQERRGLTREWNRLDGLRQKYEKNIDELQRKVATLSTQRDRYNLLFSEIIAMIRVNVMRDTFKNCTIEDLEAHLEPWIKRREEVKNITF
jgi:hypothetical protein